MILAIPASSDYLKAMAPVENLMMLDVAILKTPGGRDVR
jgi:hypothetical protein